VATDGPIEASVAGRYASALFELATELNKTREVESDLVKFQGLYDSSEDLSRMVRSPVISADEQANAVSEILSAAQADPVSINFFKLLAKNRRLFAAPDMIKAFRAIAARSRGEVTAEVSSAIALNDQQVAELKQTLKEKVGKDVTLSQRVDPSLLGGLVVKLGSRMIDSSLKTKLTNMKVALRGTGG
jgi:F-type H+-transporting ATPase subunit delta